MMMRSVAIVVLGAAVVACTDAAPPAGTAQLSLENRSGSDIFVDTNASWYFLSFGDGTPIYQFASCECGTEACSSRGAPGVAVDFAPPQPQTTAIPDGETLTAAWDGYLTVIDEDGGPFGSPCTVQAAADEAEFKVRFFWGTDRDIDQNVGSMITQSDSIEKTFLLSGDVTVTHTIQ